MEREALFWGRITDALWRPKRLLQRMEVGFADGIPDAYYAMDPSTGWIELKSPLEPTRKSTALFSGNHKLSTAQRNWLVNHRQCGGNGWVAIETEHHVLLVGARHVDVVNSLPLDELREIATFKAVRPMKPRDWTRFAWVLANAKEAMGDGEAP